MPMPYITHTKQLHSSKQSDYSRLHPPPKVHVVSWMLPVTHLVPLAGADGQSVGNQQRHVLLLHPLDAGHVNDHLQHTEGGVGGGVSSNTPRPQQTCRWTKYLIYDTRYDSHTDLGVLQQDRGVEAGVGVRDVQSSMVGHLLLPRADVCWWRHSYTGYSTFNASPH